MIILQYHEVYFRVTAPKCPGLAAGAVSLRKSHDIVILSFCNIVKVQAKFVSVLILKKDILMVFFFYLEFFFKNYFYLKVQEIVS